MALRFPLYCFLKKEMLKHLGPTWLGCFLELEVAILVLALGSFWVKGIVWSRNSFWGYLSTPNGAGWHGSERLEGSGRNKSQSLLWQGRHRTQCCAVTDERGPSFRRWDTVTPTEMHLVFKDKDCNNNRSAGQESNILHLKNWNPTIHTQWYFSFFSTRV